MTDDDDRHPLDEAEDPTTDPDRLAELAYDRDPIVAEAARSNPNLPTEELVGLIRLPSVAAWRNPAFDLALLTGGVDAERLPALALECLWRASWPLDEELGARVFPLVEQWWRETHDPRELFSVLTQRAERSAWGSPEHRDAVRAGYVCALASAKASSRSDHEADEPLIATWLGAVKNWLDEPTAQCPALSGDPGRDNHARIAAWLVVDLLRTRKDRMQKPGSFGSLDIYMERSNVPAHASLALTQTVVWALPNDKNARFDALRQRNLRKLADKIHQLFPTCPTMGR